MNINKGFSLVELVVFIIVIGLLVSAILLPFSTALQNAPTPNQQLTALVLAQARMELILGQHRIIGFSFNDSCYHGCTPQTGYTVTSTIGTPTSIAGDVASNYKTIQVTTTGLGNATVNTLVSTY